MADYSEENATPEYTTYGGLQDRPEYVNHPDNLTAPTVSTDPAAVTSGPTGYTYDPETDSYIRNGQ
jgi:hypothetical protein